MSSDRAGRWFGRGLRAALIASAAALGLSALRRRTKQGQGRLPVSHTSRAARNLELARMGVGIGSVYATTNARKLFASAGRRAELDEELKLRTAEHVAERLGHMKGALMKIGQMASYLDDGLPEPVRLALAELQSNAPPMSSELAAQVITEELGAPPEKVFVEWDPEPIAAASIGQVHRAVIRDEHTGVERAVAVKVQYPGVADAIESDLRNTDLLGMFLRQSFSSLDPSEMVAEIKERLTEELDYTRERDNQQRFVDFYRGHPFIKVPEVVHPLCTRRVLTTELAIGSTWSEALTWDQQQRDLIGESLFRFVFRSLYRMRAFNGDPHPGNYLFHGDGRITFLDFGLVRYFSDSEIALFGNLVKAAALDNDPAEFRRLVEDGGLLLPGAPVDTQDVGEYFYDFYAPVGEDATMRWTKEYASGIVRHTFDRSSPIAQYATVPRAFVFIQRINLGLYALLGDLGATGNYRRVAEELWPFTSAPPTTSMGELERAWLQSK
jgi:predicted unusual protein kinase regulating ubiquinone biosynthesis (AarF/ABC1/UbiB family)